MTNLRPAANANIECDWPQDFGEPRGQNEHVCAACSKTFLGLPARVLCMMCIADPIARRKHLEP